MSNQYRFPGPSSELTQIRKNRMIYANYLIQQQNVKLGSQATMGLENGLVAAGSIMPQLQLGAVYTTVAERERILTSSASRDPPSISAIPLITGIGAGDTTLYIVFDLISDGGSPIIDYQYTFDNGSTYISAGTTQSPITISGLTNGTSYTVRIRAVNSVGASSISNEVTATPSLTRNTFTTLGTTTWTAPVNIFSVQYLIVGGGGGSGGGYDTGGGGGGGGGMLLTGRTSIVPGTVYTVIVGDGGAAGISNRTSLPEIPGGAGETSRFGSILALGGSGGWPSRQPAFFVNGNGGSAAINPTTAANGGNGGGSLGGGGGGGGSTGAGGDGSGSTAGTGGSGTANSLSGSSVTYGVGGNGGTGNFNNAGTDGTANTGNGAKGGGAIAGQDENGGKGGSGIVILVY
jgi:hypothetical protein